MSGAEAHPWGTPTSCPCERAAAAPTVAAMRYRDTTPLHGWPDSDELDMLRTEYRGWRFWRSLNDQREPAGWYAGRTGELSDAMIGEGLARTLGGDSADELREHLRDQERLERLHGTGAAT